MENEEGEGNSVIIMKVYPYECEIKTGNISYPKEIRIKDYTKYLQDVEATKGGEV